MNSSESVIASWTRGHRAHFQGRIASPSARNDGEGTALTFLGAGKGFAFAGNEVTFAMTLPQIP